MHEGESPPNANQIIDLALLYARLDRTENALATIRRVPVGKLTSFGRFLVESVLYRCALAQGNATEAATRFAYLSDHRDDAPTVYDLVLLEAGREDEAASLLISRLDNPWRRSGALMSVQQFRPGAETPHDARLRQRWRSIVTRSDVQGAIAQVGRAGIWDIPFEGG